MKVERIERWAPHQAAAPRTSKARSGKLGVAANGTRTCSGGWQIIHGGVKQGQVYAIETAVSHRGLQHPRDTLVCLASWGRVPRGQSNVGGTGEWHYVLPRRVAANRLAFGRTLRAPKGARYLTVRYVFRWSAAGSSTWTLPRVAPAKLEPGRAVKVCVVTGHMNARPSAPITIRDNVAFYGRLCRAACKGRPDLILLPEIALDWGVPGSALDKAMRVPGPETRAFAEIARKHKVRIGLGMHERDGDAVHNSLVFVGPDGRVDGRYRKVHLAIGESFSGVMPGDSFPVFQTELGRIGANICMDSSCAESSRMVGLNGADFLCLSIMGDHRADRWSPGPPVFSESRWKAIMRTHAIDNQLCMVVARNRVQGSCVIDRKGDVLAWNEGDRDFVQATVRLEDGYRSWNGGCFRDVNWMQRRPHLYAAETDPANVGSLR